MGQENIENHLKRRILTEEGWKYFCRICGKWLPAENFYKSNKYRFGLNTKCKLHYNKKNEVVDKEMEYLKLNPLRDEDFVGTQELLEKLGYKFGPGELPVHEQFNIKHNFNGQTKDDEEARAND